MSPAWEERIADPMERNVFQALSDPAWDFRTVDGISKSTGISKSEVSRILQKYPELVRKSPVPDHEGRDLYALRSRSVSAREIIAEIRSFVTKSTQ